jgi:hypothetical protein
VIVGEVNAAIGSLYGIGVGNALAFIEQDLMRPVEAFR